MKMDLKQLSVDDGIEVYQMLQRIGKNENEFKNTAYGLDYKQFKEWLIQQDDWSRGEQLPDQYVAQTIFWLYVEDIPVGIGKIRHKLNENSKKIGGNIGYAIDPLHRNKGYATILLNRLIIKADELGVKERLLSVEKYNPASKHVIENNGGILIKETTERWFFSI